MQDTVNNRLKLITRFKQWMIPQRCLSYVIRATTVCVGGIFVREALSAL